jgi:uncharacterized protein YbaR (Trm112 family)
MSSEQLGTCPDCGREYRDPSEVYPPPSDAVIAELMPWSEYVAQTHQDFECPVQKERELVAGLEAALRHFGLADTLAKLGEIVRDNEHDVEIIFGDAERWLRREQGQPVCCPNCDAHLGVVEGGRLRMGAVILDPEDEGTNEIVCVACEKTFALKTALANVVHGKQPQPHSLTLVQSQENQEEG